MPSTRLISRGIAVGLASAAFCLVAINACAEPSNGSHRPVSGGEYQAAGKFHLRVRLIVRSGLIHYAQAYLVERCSDGSRKHRGFTFRYTVPGLGLPIQPSGAFKYAFQNGTEGYEVFQGRFDGNRVVGLVKASHPKYPAGDIFAPICGTVTPKGLPVHFSGHLSIRH